MTFEMQYTTVVSFESVLYFYIDLILVSTVYYNTLLFMSKHSLNLYRCCVNNDVFVTVDEVYKK